MEREEAIQLAKAIRDRIIGIWTDTEREADQDEYDVVSVCDHLINRDAQLSYALRQQADRVYTLAERIKEAGDQESPGGSTHSAVRRMSSLGYELAEMILGIKREEE